MPPRTLLLAAGSQLGHDILRTWPEGSVIPLTHAQCDVTNSQHVRDAIAAHRPALVVNLAASHRVDELERDPAEALRVNAQGAWLVASAAAAAGAAVLWVSTDYVFSGAAGAPYREGDRTEPLNVYGVSKAAGERLVALANPRHLIVRSSGLYGVAGASGKGGNFVETMLRLARAGRPLRVVDDQVLGPTSTLDLARAIFILATAEVHGIVHVTNAGAISWHDFAARIFARCGLRADLTPVRSEEYGAPARRPPYSVLANERLSALGLPPLRGIDEALTDYLRAKGHIS